MTEKPQAGLPGTLDFACPEEDVVVIRVSGRGSFQNSGALKAIPRLAAEQNPGVTDGRRFVVDLERCITMDSTFFGVLASIGLGQMRAKKGKTVLVNTNAHIRKILETLGLNQILELHDPPTGAEELAMKDFKAVDVGETEKLERIVLMLEAHKQLVEVYGSNEARFRNVMECLEASLDREKKGGGNGGGAGNAPSSPG